MASDSSYSSDINKRSVAMWLLSYSSDESYGSRKQKQRYPHSDTVSKWCTKDLHEKNIFYNDKASTLIDFVQRVKESACERRGFVFNNPNDAPDIIHDLVKYTKEVLWFSYDEDIELQTGKGAVYTSHDDTCENLKDCDNYTSRLIDENKDMEKKNRKLLLNWCLATAAFLKYFKLFLTTKLQNAQESKLERELLMSFSRIFYMVPEHGAARKRELEIRKQMVESIPDIHYMKDAIAPKLYETLAVVSVEVKRTEIDVPSNMQQDFKAYEMIDSKVLGQHGGELLLESMHSAFDPQVLGMICLKSKVMFTYMDLNGKHLEKIMAEGKVADVKHRCTIYYTRPYDYLIKSERDEILEFLFWIGYLQSIDNRQPDDY